MWPRAWYRTPLGLVVIATTVVWESCSWPPFCFSKVHMRALHWSVSLLEGVVCLVRSEWILGYFLKWFLVEFLIILSVAVAHGHFHVKGAMSTYVKFTGACQIGCQVKAKSLYFREMKLYVRFQPFSILKIWNKQRLWFLVKRWKIDRKHLP